jgi:biotin carboxyl carrier protein
MGRHDAGAARWYADLVRLASYPVEEVRNTDAWVMGQDTSDAAFHETLLTMLEDVSLLVRGNAALSLVRFGDASGRAQIVALLRPAVITAPSAGVVSDTDKIGTAIHQGGVIAKLQDGQQTVEVRSPISGRIRALNAQKGTNVTAGFEIATVAPGDEQVWEALRALFLIGQLDDLPAILPYQRELPEIPDRVRQQALLTEKAIRERATQRPPDSGRSPVSESEKNSTL